MEDKLKAHQENGLPPKYVDAVYDVDLFVEMAKAILLKHRIHFEGAEVCSIAHLIAIQYQTRGKDNAQ
jgi:hypothetical protein